MRILVSGASGFVGAPLVSFLESQGFTVVALTHSSSVNSNSIFWDPNQRILPKEPLEKFDVVIHLSGESIGSALWTASKREKILSSRVLSTSLLSETLSELNHPPQLFLSASAVGYYGNRGDELLDEESSPGSGFLSHVCSEWEKASHSLEEKGVRIAHLRFGNVLRFGGGMVSKLLPFYKLGLGATLGSGEQWMSWIALSDLIRAIDFVIKDEDLKGAINFVSPNPVRQKEFSQLLAHLLDRPHFLKIPALLLRLLPGSMGDELFLSSSRVIPQKLLKASFEFKHPTLKECLQTEVLYRSLH